jgi:exosortase F-associated protein
MPKNNLIIRILLGIICVFGLILVRGFEDFLFDDPLKLFFKSYNYQAAALPSVDSWVLFLNYFFRYFINTLLSLALIYLCFLDKNLLKFSLLLYGTAFVILSLIFFSMLKAEILSHQTLFYIRRFIIHPIFVLLFIPGFYYQKSFKFENENSPD